MQGSFFFGILYPERKQKQLNFSKISSFNYPNFSHINEKENPKIRKELVSFFREIENTWKKLSPFIGEEDAYGKWSFELSDNIQIKGFPFSFIVWFVLLKKTSEKLDRELKTLKRKLDKELKWFKDNREFLDLMVKEYIKEKVNPKKKEPSYRA